MLFYGGDYISNYLSNNFKGVYRIESNYDIETHDIPREANGTINQSYDDTFISCNGGNQIYHFGGRVLCAYIPSLKRGNRIIKELLKEGIKPINIEETSSEILFRFNVKDITSVALKLKARTSGANISPFSNKRLPKSSAVVPLDELQKYKVIIANIPKEDILVIHWITQSFLTNILIKKHKGIDVKADMKKKNMSRQVKEYIYFMGMWEEYLQYLSKRLEDKEK